MLLGIISDIHEDAERLTIAVKHLEKLNCDRIACLGDISGYDDRFYGYHYSRNLIYCIDLIKSNCRDIIPGNHDFFHMSLLPGYGFNHKKVNHSPISHFEFPDNWYELPIDQRKKLSKGEIWLYENDLPVPDAKLFRTFFGDFTDQIIVESDGLRILLTHSIHPDISGFLTKKPSNIKDFRDHFNLIKENNCELGFSGHLHPNGLLKITEKKMLAPKFSETEIVPGEIAQYILPCIADGLQDNGFCILDTKNKSITAIPIRTPRHNLGWL
ncbi:MAG: metallophosphoesterase [Ignavibacteriaceae bacterium]